MSLREKHCLKMEVRDYECDMQALVNNSVYLNYFEHARHLFLKEMGVDFAYFTEQKIFLVVTSLEIKYKKSLKSGDEFFVASDFERVSPLRFKFIQKIYDFKKEEIMAEAFIFGTAVNEEGRPCLSEDLDFKMR